MVFGGFCNGLGRDDGFDVVCVGGVVERILLGDFVERSVLREVVGVFLFWGVGFLAWSHGLYMVFWRWMWIGSRCDWRRFLIVAGEFAGL